MDREEIERQRLQELKERRPSPGKYIQLYRRYGLEEFTEEDLAEVQKIADERPIPPLVEILEASKKD